MTQKLLDDCLRLSKILVHKHDQHFRHFSFIVQDKKIIEWGVNRTAEPIKVLGYSTHQKIHSEFMAYKAARGLLDKNKPFEMVNIRLSKKNELKMSKPCATCLSWLSTLNCTHIWYSTSTGIFQKI